MRGEQTLLLTLDFCNEFVWKAINSYFNFDREIKKGRFCSSSTSPFIWEIENFYTFKLP